MKQRKLMNKITIDIKPKNLKKVLSILEALKPELIENIHAQKSQSTKEIKPVKSSLDKIENKSQPEMNSGRYLSKDAYKKKLQKQPIIEDEFLAGKQNSGKYLSPENFKNKLKK